MGTKNCMQTLNSNFTVERQLDELTNYNIIGSIFLESSGESSYGVVFILSVWWVV